MPTPASAAACWLYCWAVPGSRSRFTNCPLRFSAAMAAATVTRVEPALLRVFTCTLVFAPRYAIVRWQLLALHGLLLHYRGSIHHRLAVHDEPRAAGTGAPDAPAVPPHDGIDQVLAITHAAPPKRWQRSALHHDGVHS